jgi:hypothetical protein
MKILATTLALAAFFFVTLSDAGQAQYKKGGLYLGPTLTFTDPIGFGASLEYGIGDNIGIGGLLRFWSQSQTSGYIEFTGTIIMPQVLGYYHFMPKNALDPFIGARFGYAIQNASAKNTLTGQSASASESSGAWLSLAGGTRYFFTSKISGQASLEFKLAGEKYFADDFDFMIGVDFTL